MTASLDPERTFSETEKQRLTHSLFTLTMRVEEGAYATAHIAPSLLCALHRELFHGVRDHAGMLRAPGVGSEYLTYGPHRSVHRDDVPRDLDRVLGRANQMVESFTGQNDDAAYEEKALHVATWTHAEVIRIHPFEDGNGRASRLMMGLILQRLGMPQIPIEACRDEYIAALDRYYTHKDIQPLLDLLLGIVRGSDRL